MKKSILSFLLVFLPLLSNADESGTYGKNVIWTYSEATQTLTISGNGNMRNLSLFGSIFPYHSDIKKVVIESGVTSIGDHAFDGCSSLSSVTIPSSVTSIGDFAFYGCHSLTSIAIPNNVTSIGFSAFESCSGLTSITIPNSVTSIGKFAFESCKGLISVSIPNSLTSIEEGTFYGCSSLISVTIPNSVTNIGYNAFRGCSSLTSVTFGNNVAIIGEQAFSGCWSLTSITIPHSVTSIGGWAFSSSRSLLTDVYCLATDVPKTSSISFDSPSKITLHVPEGCAEKYAAATPWKNFKQIKEFKSDFIITPYDVTNDGTLDDEDLKNLLDVIMEKAEKDGKDINLDTNNDGKIDVLDIVQFLGLMNDVKEGRLLDIDEENEGGYSDPTETEQQIMQQESNEEKSTDVAYTDEQASDYDALAREVINLYDTDDDSDYNVNDANKTRGAYDDLAKEAIRRNGKNIFEDIVIEQQDRNIKNWGNTRYGGFKTFYNTREENGIRYLYVVFYKKGGFPNKKTAYLKLGQVNSGKIIKDGSITISPGQEFAVLRVCIDKYIPGYGCFNVFPLLITEESKARNYLNPILVKSAKIVADDWRNKNYGYEFGKINGVSVYCNTSTAGWNIGGPTYQCVELCKRYVKQLNSNVKRLETDIWGHAKNWPYNRENDTKDPGKYLVFPNDGREPVREGDLLVWNHGDYGHIGVVISVKADKISVAHQNGDTGMYASPIGTSMKLENGIIKDIVPGTNRSPIFKSIQYVPYFIRMNSANEHFTPYEASMSASTTKMEFSSIQVGKSATQTFVINNPKGMGDLNISSISLSKGDAFSVDITNGTVSAGDAQVIRVTFTPTAAGEYKDRIIIKSNADDNPTWAIHLTGYGKGN